MGSDDTNVGGPGECPGHQFELEQLVTVVLPGRRLPSLVMERTCSWCGTKAIEQ